MSTARNLVLAAGTSATLALVSGALAALINGATPRQVAVGILLFMTATTGIGAVLLLIAAGEEA